MRMQTLLGAAMFAMGAAGGQAAQLTVEAQGIGSGEGEVLVALCRTSFDEAGCPAGKRAAARPGTMAFTFPDIPSGPYAVAVYHDINANGRLDTIPPGIPIEPYGFSNDVGRFGPPSLRRSLVSVAEGANLVRVNVRRLFP